MSNKDQAKGRIKQALGDLAGDDDLKREGKLDEHGGKLKDAMSSVKDKMDDAVDAVKDKLSKK